MKHLLKNSLLTLILAGITLVNTSCATVFGGHVSNCQRTKPQSGQPTRSIRGVALVADILFFFPGAIIDFATGAIYKPCTVSTAAAATPVAQPVVVTTTAPVPQKVTTSHPVTDAPRKTTTVSKKTTTTPQKPTAPRSYPAKKIVN